MPSRMDSTSTSFERRAGRRGRWRGRWRRRWRGCREGSTAPPHSRAAARRPPRERQLRASGAAQQPRLPQVRALQLLRRLRRRLLRLLRLRLLLALLLQALLALLLLGRRHRRRRSCSTWYKRIRGHRRDMDPDTLRRAVLPSLP